MPEIDYTLNVADTDRIRSHYLTECGKMQKVLCQYETLIDDKWIPIVRYDTAHGCFHKDILHINGTKEKREVNYVELDAAAKDARRDLMENWESYKFRYFSEKRR